MPTAKIPNWVIIGCGYTGTRLARELIKEGCQVLATRTSQEGCEELSRELPGVRTQRFSLSQGKLSVPEKAMVVLSVPPDSSAPREEAAFAQGLPESCRLLYLSTTGVFGQSAGELVDDTAVANPLSERGNRRVLVEEAIAAAHQDTICLRVPGIYGPHRGMHYRMKMGRYRLIGSADTMVSRIHVDDLVAAIEVLGNAPSLGFASCVVGDEQPCSSRSAAMGVAALLDLPEPPSVDANSVSHEIRAMLGAGRRIDPRRLHALGWKAQYPSWREGVAQATAEERSSEMHSETEKPL